MSEHKQKKPYPASLAFFLSNPIRRWFQPPSELLNKIEIKSTDVVMDFGCGPGYYTLEIAKRAKSVLAVDISPEMLKKVQSAAGKAKVKNIKFIQSDGKTIQIKDKTVDIIVLVTVYHEISEHKVVLKEFSRILKPKGRLIIVESTKKSRLPGPPVQNPDALKAEIEGSELIRQQQPTIPYKRLGIFIFAKTT